jgi:hypothetical protein
LWLSCSTFTRLSKEIGEFVGRLQHCIWVAAGEVSTAAEIKPDTPRICSVAKFAATITHANAVVAVTRRATFLYALRIAVRRVPTAWRTANSATRNVRVLCCAPILIRAIVTVTWRIAAIIFLGSGAIVFCVAVLKQLDCIILHTIGQELAGLLIHRPSRIVLQHQSEDARNVWRRHRGTRINFVGRIAPSDSRSNLVAWSTKINTRAKT